MISFETPRLAVRPVEASDFEHAYRLLSDPEVMRYITTPFTTPEQMQERMDIWLGYAEKRPGFGTFVLTQKSSGQFMGTCVARQWEYNPESADYEIGYVFLPEFWGQGYASELIPSLCAYCFERSNAEELMAITDPDNGTSQHLLKKSGFRYVGDRETTFGKYNYSTEFRLSRSSLLL